MRTKRGAKTTRAFVTPSRFARQLPMQHREGHHVRGAGEGKGRSGGRADNSRAAESWSKCCHQSGERDGGVGCTEARCLAHEELDGEHEVEVARMAANLIQA